MIYSDLQGIVQPHMDRILDINLMMIYDIIIWLIVIISPLTQSNSYFLLSNFPAVSHRELIFNRFISFLDLIIFSVSFSRLALRKLLNGYYMSIINNRTGDLIESNILIPTQFLSKSALVRFRHNIFSWIIII